MSIIYPLDIHKPYEILMIDEVEDTCMIKGYAKECAAVGGYLFGGHEAIYPHIRFWDLFNKSQKRSLKWYRKQLGDRRADQRYAELRAAVIAAHSRKGKYEEE